MKQGHAAQSLLVHASLLYLEVHGCSVRHPLLLRSLAQLVQLGHNHSHKEVLKAAAVHPQLQ